MQRLLPDVTIEEIGQLLKSLDDRDMDELLVIFVDDETRQKLKDRLP